MKEKIDQYARGIFEYSTPEIIWQPASLSITVDAGDTIKGSFIVSNAKGRRMKGIVNTDCSRLLLEQEAFQGEKNEISFVFRATCCQPGEVIRGTIQVFSDCGTASMPFTVTVAVPACETSAGRIRDLNQFAALAKTNPAEALRIFGDARFARIFLEGHPQMRELYRGLWKGSSRSMALEEFLIAVHKKTPVKLTTEKKELQYPECAKSFADRILLRREGWGFCEYEVRTDASFVRLERSCVRSADFTGDSCELSFVIDTERMAPGHNFARITVRNARQNIEITVIARKFCLSDDARRQQIGMQRDIWNLYRNFVYQQTGQISRKAYLESLEALLVRLEKHIGEETQIHTGKRYRWLLRGFRIQEALLKQQEERFHMEMALLEGELDHLREQEPLLYGAYYYLLFLWKREAAERAGAAQCLRECYLTGNHHWLVLWFWLQVEEDRLSSVRRQELILEQLEYGCASPLLYLELCRVYDKAPELLLDLTAARAQALHWGYAHGILKEEQQFRYAYLIHRSREFSEGMLRDLCSMYEQNPSEDLLTMICQLLMRGRRNLPGAAKWYLLGITHHLKLTELYENYMYALEETPDMVLPESVLLYFSYNNQLNTNKKAMLYAYVIRHRAQDPETYEKYETAMRRFALEQLEQGRISDHLAVIYEEFVTAEALEQEPEAARRLPSVIFAQEIVCRETGIVEAAVRHKEVQQEETAVFTEGSAVVSVFTSEPQIFLIDREGNRYASAVNYTMHPLVHLEALAEQCMAYAGDNVRLLLHLYEKMERAGRKEEELAGMRRKILSVTGLAPEYRRQMFAAQMRYYFESFQGELLDEGLAHLDWGELRPEEREEFIGYCAVRHNSAKGMEGLLLFGWKGMDPRKLLGIASPVMEKGQEDPVLVKLAWYIFQHGEFDGGLLQYLCDYYTGQIADMAKLWNACRQFGTNVQRLSERILAQILFTDQMVPEAYEIFFTYEETGHHKKLVRAFLKRAAYRYLVHREALPEQMFALFYQNVQVEENRPCLLAVLKHLSGRQTLTGGEAVFVDYNLSRLYEKNIIFPFYRDFGDTLAIPDRLQKEQYIEYTADPESEVKIRYHYVVAGNVQEDAAEPMRDMFAGIRVKGFVLFQDETVEYQVVERTPGGEEKRTQTFCMKYANRERTKNGQNGYQMLNQMIAGMSSDSGTLLDQMEKYAEKKAAAARLVQTVLEQEGGEKHGRG